MSWLSALLVRAASLYTRTRNPDPEHQNAAERHLAEARRRSLTTGQVLASEYQEIWGEIPEALRGLDPRKRQPANRTEAEERDAAFLAAYSHDVLSRDQAALCLSGGGIRSAAFALGVIQALAQMGLLSKFHYLSTVSGGGYIGGWLSRLIKEETDHPTAQGGSAQEAATPYQVALSVERKLASSVPEDRDAITRLREVSNFLTPKVGPVSTDTWSAAVLCMRNVLLNWSVFVPLLMLVALTPNMVARFADHMGGRTDDASCITLHSLLFWGLGVLLVGEYFSCSFLPSHKMGKEKAPSPTVMWAKGKAHVNVIVFGCLWAATLTFFAAALSEGAGELTA
jgi:hypothetical protein